jgi:predicted transcriptional regulator
MAESGKEMTFIVTSKVLERFKEVDEARLNRLIHLKNVTFLLLNETDNAISPSMTITDVFVYAYLFNTDGVYDNKIIISSDDQTHSWFKKLYQHFQDQADLLK